ncbi:MAG: Na(+)/H(+) antiporter subunit B [Verrucomicrobia bacterium]|nr:Na(+)/H(+) antiporter subunit B [Verrucomicrobiota bacterium]
MIPALDILLIVALLWLARQALVARDLFKGVVLFIAFGLLLALAWVRLRAPDIALAEAAIGSGLTGALFLSTLGRLRRMEREAGQAEPPPEDGRRGGWTGGFLTAAGTVLVTALLGWAVWALPAGAPGLGDAVQARLGESGVSHRVTAVLLNFRAYDTLLEVGVLLVAIVAVWAVARADFPFVTRNAEAGSVPPQQTALVNLLVPVMLVVAGYLLWIGATAPGGAFQAGAVLGGAGVLLLLSRPHWAVLPERRWMRTGLAAGLLVFLGVGLALVIAGRRLLEYPAGWAGALILLIEAAVTLSIGLTLTLLFLGGRPAAGDPAPTMTHTNQQP